MTAFHAASVPAGARLADAPRVALPGGDVRMSAPALDPAALDRITTALTAGAAELRARPAADLAAVLGRVGTRFGAANDPLRVRALELLPATSGLSAAMAREVLDGMARDWTEGALTGVLRADLGDPRALDGFTTLHGRRLHAVGPALCVQVVAGSVPGVGVTALLRSLLVKAPTLLKPGRGDAVLPVLFADALREEDPTLADSLAVVYWAGGTEELDRAALSAAELVVAYGADRTIGALRRLCPDTTRFVAYHHRLGVGAVGSLALTEATAARTAAEVARSIAWFDQRGCVSPHLLLVDARGEVGPAGFATLLAAELERLEERLPAGPLELEEAAALQQLRGTAEMLSASGSGHVAHGGASGSWTVVLEREGALPAPGVGRVARLRPFHDLDEIPESITPWRAHLQTLGVAGFGDDLEALAEACGRVGVTRVAPFGAVPFPPPWWYHDGRAPVGELVRWVEIEGDGAGQPVPVR